MTILRRTIKAMTRAMCGLKMTEKRRSQELMSLLGLRILWTHLPGRVECDGMGMF